MDGDGADAPQRSGARRQGQPVEQRLGRAPVVQLEGKHPAAGAQLALGDGELGVAGQARVVDGVDAAALEVARQGERVGRVPLHAHVERRDAAQHQEGALRGERAAGVDLHPADFRDQVGPADHRAGEHVRMAADPLGQGLHDEVRAELDGPAQPR